MKKTYLSINIAVYGLLFICAAAIAQSGSPEVSAANNDWPMFRGNAQMTGVSNTELPEQLDLIWRFQTDDEIVSTAAIVGERVFVASADGHLYALDLASGEQIWKYAANGDIKSSPTVADGTVFFGDGDGMLHAISAENGSLKWQFQTEGEIISSVNISGEWLVFG